MCYHHPEARPARDWPPCLTDEETVAQVGEAAGPRSHRKTGLEPKFISRGKEGRKEARKRDGRLRELMFPYPWPRRPGS